MQRGIGPGHDCLLPEGLDLVRVSFLQFIHTLVAFLLGLLIELLLVSVEDFAGLMLRNEADIVNLRPSSLVASEGCLRRPDTSTQNGTSGSIHGDDIARFRLHPRRRRPFIDVTQVTGWSTLLACSCASRVRLSSTCKGAKPQSRDTRSRVDRVTRLAGLLDDALYISSRFPIPLDSGSAI